MKNFAKTKNSRMFAVPKFIQISIVGVFLCTANSVLANNTGYQTLLGNTTIGIVMDFGELGGDSLSYIHLLTNKFSSKMPESTKITNSVKNSNGIGTFASRNEANLLNFIESLHCRWVGLKYKRTHYELRLIISKHSRHFVKGETLDELFENLKVRLLGFGIISLTENKA